MLSALLALLLLAFLLLPGCSREPSHVTDADTTRVTDSVDGTTSQVPEDQLGSYQGEAVTGPMQNQLALGVHNELNNNTESPDMSQVAETFINDLSLHLRGQSQSSVS